MDVHIYIDFYVSETSKFSKWLCETFIIFLIRCNMLSNFKFFDILNFLLLLW